MCRFPLLLHSVITVHQRHRQTETGGRLMSWYVLRVHRHIQEVNGYMGLGDCCPLVDRGLEPQKTSPDRLYTGPFLAT